MITRAIAIAAAGAMFALLNAGCEKDYRPKDVDPAKVKAAVKSLSHDQFDKLTSTEQFDFLTIITKMHGIPYLIGPSDVQIDIPSRPGAYDESLFEMHDTPKVVAFLEKQLDKRLDNALQAMKSDDMTSKNREVRLVNRLATDYLQALVVMNLSEEYREYKAKAGPQAPDPYMRSDALLVNTGDDGVVQLYMAAARAGDESKLAELRQQIEAVFQPYRDKTADFTPPKTPPDMQNRGF